MRGQRSRKAARGAAGRRPLVKRIDGARHWPKTLDQFLWLLLRAGITPDQLTQAVGASLRKHRKTRGLTMPSPEVLEYGRVLTYWQHEPAYLDEHGNARSLSLTGRSPSFASLVRQSVPNAQASDVLAVLSRHGLVSTGRRGQRADARHRVFAAPQTTGADYRPHPLKPRGNFRYLLFQFDD